MIGWKWKGRTHVVLPSREDHNPKPTALDKIAAKLYLRWKSRKLKK